MLIENEFTVAAPIDFLWAYLLDVEKIAPCMPGAELTEVVDDQNWKGKLNAKFGPVSMSFAGTVTIESATTPRTAWCSPPRAWSRRARGREREGDVVARARPGDDGDDREDGGRHHAHRRGRAAVARVAAGDLEEADADVRRLPAGVDGRGEHARRRRCGDAAASDRRRGAPVLPTRCRRSP